MIFYYVGPLFSDFFFYKHICIFDSKWLTSFFQLFPSPQKVHLPSSRLGKTASRIAKRDIAKINDQPRFRCFWHIHPSIQLIKFLYVNSLAYTLPWLNNRPHVFSSFWVIFLLDSNSTFLHFQLYVRTYCNYIPIFLFYVCIKLENVNTYQKSVVF